MRSTIFPLFGLALVACGGQGSITLKEAIASRQAARDTAAVYRTAIADLIRAMDSTDMLLPDTIFIGRHPEFPGIELPPEIAGRTILLIDPGETEVVKYRKRFAYLNILATWSSAEVEFFMVRFREGFSHRPDGAEDRFLTYGLQDDGSWKLLRVEPGSR
jgi:hypothetical protein